MKRSFSERLSLFNGATLAVLRITVSVFLVLCASYLFVQIWDFVIDYEFGRNDIVPQEKIIHPLEGEELISTLSLIAIFAGLLAYVFKTIVASNIFYIAEKKEEEARLFTEAQSLKVSSVVHYYNFCKNRDFLEFAEEIKHRDCYSHPEENVQKTLAPLERAIAETEKAIPLVSRIDGSSLKNELLVCILKNNIAWFYVEKFRYVRKYFRGARLEIEERNCLAKMDYIYSNAKYAYEKREKHSEHSGYWKDTYKKVVELFEIKS